MTASHMLSQLSYSPKLQISLAYRCPVIKVKFFEISACLSSSS